MPRSEIPADLLPGYMAAAETCPGLPWQVLAGIGWVESRHGRGHADPTTGQRSQRDLPMAAEVIDLLALLREKTDGRRSAEETQVLDELLYDLQLRYVSATKRPG